jgi:23S rRNA (pseudouridine1915-N3)-methyltransferase
MKLVLLSIETSRQNWFGDVAELYQKKISHYVPLTLQRLKTKNRTRDAQDRKIAEEGELLLKQIEPSDYVIVCDERGQIADTKAFSKKMISALESGKKRVVFIVGGAYGTSDEVKRRADMKWNLSPMTMNHFVAQVVALEQIYRALTIWKGVPYHNE